MTTFAIYCPELPERYEAAKLHFAQMGVQAEFVRGIHAQTFGILSWRPYVLDYPTIGFLLPMAHVGLCLSHYMVWSIASFMNDDYVMIVEDDAEFPADWKLRVDQSIADCPDNWDIILIGNSNCSDKPIEHVKGEVFIVKYPFCTHAYIVRKKALHVLLEKVRDASLKIDVALIMMAYPHLNVYTVLTSICLQRGTVLMP